MYYDIFMLQADINYMHQAVWYIHTLCKCESKISHFELFFFFFTSSSPAGIPQPSDGEITAPVLL